MSDDDPFRPDEVNIVPSEPTRPERAGYTDIGGFASIKNNNRTTFGGIQRTTQLTVDDADFADVITALQSAGFTVQQGTFGSYTVERAQNLGILGTILKFPGL